MNFVLDQYAPYVWTCYGLFAAMLVWDFLMPRLQMRRTRRDILARQRREAARATSRGVSP